MVKEVKKKEVKEVVMRNIQWKEKEKLFLQKE